MRSILLAGAVVMAVSQAHAAQERALEPSAPASADAMEAGKSGRASTAATKTDRNADLWDDAGDAPSSDAAASRSSSSEPEVDAAAGDENSDRAARRSKLGRLAQRSAQYAMPAANFHAYSFEIEAGRRIIEVVGINRQTGNQVTVDVWPTGRIESISEVIGFGDVPPEILSTIQEEITGFQPAKVQRSMMADFDVYYEFAGFSATGRPATARIRADGSDLSVRYSRAG